MLRTRPDLHHHAVAWNFLSPFPTASYSPPLRFSNEKSHKTRETNDTERDFVHRAVRYLVGRCDNLQLRWGEMTTLIWILNATLVDDKFLIGAKVS